MEELLERKKGLHRTILIVDDEIIEREMLGAMLQDSYTVIYAENGAVALDIIKQDKLTLSLIILIVNELYGRHRGDMSLKKIGGCIHELVCRRASGVPVQQQLLRDLSSACAQAGAYQYSQQCREIHESAGKDHPDR